MSNCATHTGELNMLVFFAYASGYSDADSEINDETQCHVNLSVNSSK